jgi:hypothetical protein
VIVLAVTAEQSKAKANWAEQAMSDPATSTSYDESVGSCGPPTPTTVPPPPPATASAAPVRRQLNFATGGGDLENDGDEDDEFLCRAADDIERGYNEAKLRAPPCICGRGVCAVERDGQSGRKKYVCPSRPVSLSRTRKIVPLALILPSCGRKYIGLSASLGENGNISCAPAG